MTTEQLGHILLAGDSQLIRAALSDQLEDEGYEVTQAADGEQALAHCEATPPDAIVLDVDLSGLDGHQVLAHLKANEALRDIPVIFLAGRSDSDDMDEGLRAGVHDYLTKPFEPAELIARVAGAVRVKQLQDQLREQSKSVDRVARIDALTGAYNRRHVDEQLIQHSSLARRHRYPLSVLMLDLDHFRMVNEAVGTAGGDVVLKEFVQRLRSVIRIEDVVGRWGGEEFIVIAPQTNRQGAVVLAERARNVICERPFTVSGRTVSLTVSVGCASLTDDYELLVPIADEALFTSKSTGRNRVTSPAA